VTDATTGMSGIIHDLQQLQKDYSDGSDATQAEKDADLATFTQDSAGIIPDLVEMAAGAAASMAATLATITA